MLLSSDLDRSRLRTPTFRPVFPRGATFNIVGSKHSANVVDRVSNNIENGTSAAQRLSEIASWHLRRARHIPADHSSGFVGPT
jgi:hypothetical protein